MKGLHWGAERCYSGHERRRTTPMIGQVLSRPISRSLNMDARLSGRNEGSEIGTTPSRIIRDHWSEQIGTNGAASRSRLIERDLHQRPKTAAKLEKYKFELQLWKAKREVQMKSDFFDNKSRTFYDCLVWFWRVHCMTVVIERLRNALTCA